MVIKRPIDNIKYCTSCQSFVGKAKDLRFPLVLNWLITSKCNLQCRYCFATDITNKDSIASYIINYVNQSPYLKVVISGGEPFQNRVIWSILRKIDHTKKVIVVDTNGTYWFKKSEIKLLKRKRIIIRISLDSTSPRDNERLRCHNNGQYFEKIVKNIERLCKDGVHIDLQTVVTKLNIKNLYPLSRMVRYWGIKKWYLQSLLPSGRGQSIGNLSPTKKSILRESKHFSLDPSRFLVKEDENNRAVVLLNNYGELITEDKKGNINIGNIRQVSNEDLINRIDRKNHIKRYKLLNKCLCNS